MKIYDQHAKHELQGITLYLTPAEADELGQSALQLAKDPQKHHIHVNNASFSHEVILAVYTRENWSQFDKESREVIERPESD